MGCTNSACINIALDRAQTFFYTDETISGTIKVNIKKDNFKLNELSMTLYGEAGYRTTIIVKNSYSSSHTHHHRATGSTRQEIRYNSICFLAEKIVLENPGPDKKAKVYNTGQYSWQFNIPMAHDLPPSTNDPLVYPFIRYYLKCIIKRPWYKLNNTETLYLTVYPRIYISRNPELTISHILGNINGKGVNLKGIIHRGFYVPGEMITGTLQIENSQQISLKQIHLSLIQHSVIEAENHRQIITDLTLPTVNNTKQATIEENFSLLIPNIKLPPSTQFTGGLGLVVHLNIAYILEINVKFEGFFTNIDANAPITIGTHAERNPNQQTM